MPYERKADRIMKRFLAVLLCLLMCVSMLPAVAFAEPADLDYDNSEQEKQHSHELVYVSREEPDCNGGNDAYYICSECNRPHCDVFTDNKISAHSAASHHLCFLSPEGTGNSRSLTYGAPAMEIWGAASNCPTTCLPATFAPVPGGQRPTAVKIPRRSHTYLT